MAKDIQIVGFRIGTETFGLPIALVREIVRVPKITPVPNAPDFVEGVINLRGRIISVIDLRKRFGEKDLQPSKKNRIVVVELGRRSVGLLVNSASEALNDLFQDGEVDYVTGVAKLKGRLVILLDLEKVMQRSELRRLEDVAETIAQQESEAIARR